MRSVGCRTRLSALALRRYRPGGEDAGGVQVDYWLSTAVCSEPPGEGAEFTVNAPELWAGRVTLNSLPALLRSSSLGADSETGFPPRYRVPTGRLRPNR